MSTVMTVACNVNCSDDLLDDHVIQKHVNCSDDLLDDHVIQKHTDYSDD